MKEAYFTPQKSRCPGRRLLQAPGIVHRQDRAQVRSPGISPAGAGHAALFPGLGLHAYIPSAAGDPTGDQHAHLWVQPPRDRLVFYTRHTNTPQDAGLMATWWRDMLGLDEERSQISPQIDMCSGRYSSRRTTTMLFTIFLWTSTSLCFRRKPGGDHGRMTHLCCETTARSAFMRGFQPFFLVDGTATYNRHFQIATLTNLAHGFAHLARVQDNPCALDGE